MSQLFVTAPGRLEWRDSTPRDLQAETDAIIRPLAVARCDLDPVIIAGHSLMPAPHEIGHEFVGEVVDVGSSVRRFAKGDRVVSSFAISCGACSSCHLGQHQSCRTVDKPAYFGFGALGHNFGGAVTERIRIPFADEMLLKVPAKVSNVAASSAGDNLGDAYRGVIPHLSANREAPVLVVGGSSASIGLCAVAWARWGGASIVDYFDTDRSRLEAAERLGARVFEKADPERGRKYAIAVHASGREAGLAAAIQAMDFGGRITSTFCMAQDVTIPFAHAFTTGLTLTMGDQNTRSHLPAVLSALADGFDPIGQIAVVHRWTDAAEAFLEPTPKLVVVRN